MSHLNLSTGGSLERFEGLISVSTIRSLNPFGFGGCIFSGFQVDKEGKRLSTNKLYVVIAKSYVLPSEVSKGERWRVSGNITRMDRKDYNGYRITECTLDPDCPIVKEREAGDLIINLVSKNPKFKRVGVARMRRLWNKHGDGLYPILDAGDVATLAQDLGTEDAASFVEAWGDHVSGATVSFLAAHGVPIWLCRKVLEYHGTNAKAVLEDDPYRLLSFTGSWQIVDALARSHFGVAVDDLRRLRAAIEESLYRLVDKKAHTYLPSNLVKEQLKRLLRVHENRQETNWLIAEALADSAGNGAYVVTEDGHYWPTGAHIMEEYVSGEIAKMVVNPRSISPSLFMSSMSGSEIDRLVYEFEKEEHLRLKRIFKLNKAQRQAVHNSVNNRFSVITGGAGTGKTTVLRCLYYVLGKAQYSICQMALSGRAAKRMQTATGLNATTIAGYLRNSSDIQANLGDFVYCVIDEASMLDISTAYQILRSIPDDKNVRMVMVGDPYQLPPIMPGLVFHILAENPVIPMVKLMESKRQDEASGIPAVANSIRHGILPALFPTGAGVRFIPCPDHEIIDQVLELFSEDPFNTQILAATKACPRSGTKAINTSCRERFTKGERELLVRSDVIEGAFGFCGFREKDRAMFTKNDYGRGVNNGSIGSIIEVYDEPKKIPGSDEFAIAKGEFEGAEIEIFEADVAGKRPKLELGYAATVHKAQGSQWARVIIPICQSRNLDRTLIYTAVTRAENEAILIGDAKILRDAVESVPSSHMRSVGLGHLLKMKIQALLGGATV